MEFDELKQRYFGNRAAKYDEVRAPTALWLSEQETMSKILRTLPAGASIADVPLGTGRYLSLYKEFGLRPTGLDVSDEMMLRAAVKAGDLSLPLPLVRSDIRFLPLADQSVDATVCTRLLNWIDSDGVRAALSELKRVSKRAVIFGLRSYRPGRELTFTEKLIQLKYRFYRFRTRPSLTCHPPGLIQQLFSDQKFVLREKNLVETKTFGVEYAFYMAERRL